MSSGPCRPISSPKSATKRCVQPVYERHLYQRSVGMLTAASRRVSRLQSGSIHAYLAYVFVTLVIVLLIAR
ncbi:MAG: hypothetical protein R2849_00070 [Thermomicrobiales bacterium]